MNMHSNKLVVAIKHKGKVLREFKEQIRIPFGSEYSVYIKNLNTVRALVKIEIDGKDVGDGTRFIVEPNKDINIERSIVGGNFDKGNCFKFIERTSSVEQARGIEAEDGLVRVEFQFEKVYPKIDYQPLLEKHIHHHHDHYYGSPKVFYGSGSGYSCGGFASNVSQDSLIGTASNSGGVMRSLLTKSSVASNSALGAQASANYSSQFVGNFNLCDSPVTLTTSVAPQLNEAGITVPGSVSDQKFQTGAWFATETEKHSIVLHLVGEVEGQTVASPVTVKAKSKCVTCNRVNKATANFCANCGTGLVII